VHHHARLSGLSFFIVIICQLYLRRLWKDEKLQAETLRSLELTKAVGWNLLTSSCITGTHTDFLPPPLCQWLDSDMQGATHTALCSIAVQELSKLYNQG
jgi:hypothetical protein